MRTATLLMLPLLLAAGCAAESRQAPVANTAGPNIGASSQEPQPSNSLPRGSAVDSPLTGQVGNVGTTRVGPATAPYVRPRY